MSILKVALFGGVRVTHSNWLNDTKLTREIQALLAYLLIERHRAHSKDVLAGVFWPEHNHNRARKALNTAIWRLKKVIEPQGIPTGTYLVSSHSGEIAFNPESPYWLDVEVFEQQVNRLVAIPPQEVSRRNMQQFEKDLRLYRGELLEDFYDDWALRERERLRAVYLKGLFCLMQYYRLQKSYEKASTFGQQILNLDPIREDIHREMMRLYLESGQRALAARQYAICQLALAKELGISPMDETQMLYTQIFPEAVHKHVLAPSQKPISFQQALGELLEVSQTIDLVREQVQQTMYYLTQHMKTESKITDIHSPYNGKTDRARKPRLERYLE